MLFGRAVESTDVKRVPFVFFFFSGRRRHTRLNCDWSSDVCSSDLTDRMPKPPPPPANRGPNPSPALQRAVAALQMGQIVEAERLAAEVLKANRNDVGAASILARALDRKSVV